MTALTFAPATKKALKARIALEGPSGSGKTWTSLLIALALAGPTGRIGLIDTERRKASLYADVFTFKTLQLDRFAPELLIDALAASAADCHDVCIVDSFSHFWMGQDGMLEQVDRAAKRSGGGNTFAGWKDMRPIERKMIDAMLAYPGHLIATLRTKSDWVVEENERGKKVPKKIGLKAEQREGLEFEFDLVGTMDLENTLVVTKSRCPLLSGAVVSKPTEEFGRTLLDWLNSGEAPGLSAVELRDTILADVNASRDDLLAYHQQAREAGLLATAITDETGDPVVLGDWIVARGKALAAPAAKPAAPGPAEAAADQAAVEPSPAMVTDRQHRTMHAVWRELGYAGDEKRDARLVVISKIVRRDISSSKELIEAEADAVIEALNSKKRELKAAADKPAPAHNEAPPKHPMNQAQRDEIFDLLTRTGLADDRPAGLKLINEVIAPDGPVDSVKPLTEFQAAQVIGRLRSLVPA